MCKWICLLIVVVVFPLIGLEAQEMEEFTEISGESWRCFDLYDEERETVVIQLSSSQQRSEEGNEKTVSSVQDVAGNWTLARFEETESRGIPIKSWCWDLNENTNRLNPFSYCINIYPDGSAMFQNLEDITEPIRPLYCTLVDSRP